MSTQILPFAGMLQRIDDLTANESAYPETNMRREQVPWPKMRERFKTERQRKKLTQTAVAQRGDVDQGTVSKIEGDDNYTPYVDTFVRAIHGLGLSATEFFAALEGLKSAGNNATNVGASDGEAAATPRQSHEDVQLFVLDLIDKLQDLVAAHDARRRQRTARKSHRKPALTRQDKAR